MIASLHGTVLSVGAEHVVLDVGGVGYLVSVPSAVARSAVTGDRLRLHTSLIVREDAMSLYGFAELDELETFSLLLGVTGVGPRSALGVVSHLTVDQIASAVADEDDAPFRRVSGIGPKTAKLIIMQLAGKIEPPRAQAAPVVQDGVTAQVVAALVGLGWSERTAAEAVGAVASTATGGDDESVQSLLRRTLGTLSPAQAGASRG